MDDTDEEIWGGYSAVIRAHNRDDLYDGAVLMAACHRTQVASDGSPGGGGLFTTHWLQALRAADIAPRTYEEIHRHICQTFRDIGATQRPQCDGAARRVVFEMRTIGGFPVHPRGTQFEILVPDALGVRRGDIFNLRDTSSYDQLLFSVQVNHTSSTSALAHVVQGDPMSISGHVRAFLAPAAYPLKYFIEPAVQSSAQEGIKDLEAVINKSELDNSSPHAKVGNSVEADVVFKIVANGVSYHRPDEQRDSPVITFEDVSAFIPRILSNIGRYKFYLDQDPWQHFLAEGDVAIHLHELEEVEPVGYGRYTLGRKLCPHDSEVIISENKDAIYAFVLVNKSNKPLYPFLFYFDPGDHSITEFYSPRSVSDPPLAAGGQLQLGAVNERREGYQFVARPGLARDSGYLKLFVSTHYIPLGSILPQDPLFDEHGRHILPVASRAAHVNGSEHWSSNTDDRFYTTAEMWDHPLRTPLIRGQPPRVGRVSQRATMGPTQNGFWDTVKRKVTVLAVPAPIDD